MKQFFQDYQVENDVVAAAVSGGADSLALALRLKEAGKKVVALTVDHGLRSESATEADYVAQIMRQEGIEHHILMWQGVKPVSGIEEAARRARYRLMTAFCKKNGIGVLATGHHLRDQAETFLLRLQRGSGVFGLSGILPVSYRDGIMIIRPQLSVLPEELKQYLRRRSIQWVEDPMNVCDDFLRVKIRKFLPELARIGIDEKRLGETAAVLAKTRGLIQDMVDVFMQNQVRWWNDVVVSLSWFRLKALHQEIALAVLGQLTRQVSGGDYPPEAAELKRVLLSDDFRGCTLGGCELFIAQKRLWIVPQDMQNTLMTKAQWSAFAQKYPDLRNAALPYKARRALWLKD